ncbi:hypothetical protein A2635_01465 [Candidatus Peribacteria bacterium RIFCSPHIGHO2_01_FULL_51_9]|nr:MAG: hypothetical protein A2635_01465 [Candidatus Peribacteria bacterium RIFCSPHIGHO2_01_FULL_51_9]
MPKTSVTPIFANLNAEQQKAVEHGNGPLLILAGAGSGKTRALTHRIAHLIDQGIPPWQILAVTFTNKAANEMKERIRNLLNIMSDSSLINQSFEHVHDNKQSRLPVMGTFHSICARILRRDIEKLGRDRSFVIYDSDDQEKLMKETLKEMQIDESEFKPRAALSYIGRFKCEAMSSHDAESQATTERTRKVIHIYNHYQSALKKANALDFDDLILETVRLFHEVPNTLERYQNTWRFVNVDEYQDTNHAQYLLISLLARKYRNLCVIGDPDQSIYAFRGADIRNILEFEKEYPDAIRIKLEQNYRSTQPILTAADSVIAANPNRPQKRMWTNRSEGPKIVVHEVTDERREAEEALRAVQNLQAHGTPLNAQAILYRTNAQSRLFEEACMRTGIPYRIIGGLKFYARKEVKDLLAYLHVILNPNDTLSLLRILNVPSRKIGQTTIGKLQEYSSQNTLTLWDTLLDIPHMDDNINVPTKERLAKFTSIIHHYQKKMTEMPVSQLSRTLLEDIGMEQWLRDETDEGEERWGNIQELLSVMQKYDALEPRTGFMSFLEEVSLVSEVDKLQEARSDALTLMTLHLCKGLEFEHVIIAGCEEGIFPHRNSFFDQGQLEEERRIMYVGMTRAKTHLHILFTQNRTLWGKTESNAPSRFLDDLPEEVLERRSDNILSAFAWTAKSSGKREEAVSPGKIDIEFNQDFSFTDAEEREIDDTIDTGSRIEHPKFGKGTVTVRRGDIAEITFDSGQKKNLALSIAPLKKLEKDVT